MQTTKCPCGEELADWIIEEDLDICEFCLEVQTMRENYAELPQAKRHHWSFFNSINTASSYFCAKCNLVVIDDTDFFTECQNNGHRGHGLSIGVITDFGDGLAKLGPKHLRDRDLIAV